MELVNFCFLQLLESCLTNPKFLPSLLTWKYELLLQEIYLNNFVCRITVKFCLKRVSFY